MGRKPVVAVNATETMEILTKHLGTLDGHTLGTVLGCLEGIASKGRKIEIEGKIVGVVVRVHQGDRVHEFSGSSLATVLAQMIQEAK